VEGKSLCLNSQQHLYLLGAGIRVTVSFQCILELPIRGFGVDFTYRMEGKSLCLNSQQHSYKLGASRLHSAVDAGIRVALSFQCILEVPIRDLAPTSLNAWREGKSLCLNSQQRSCKLMTSRLHSAVGSGIRVTLSFQCFFGSVDWGFGVDFTYRMEGKSLCLNAQQHSYELETYQRESHFGCIEAR